MKKQRIFFLIVPIAILFLLCSCGTSGNISFETEKQSYNLDTTNISCTLTNRLSDKAIAFQAYSIEKNNNGTWEKVPLEILQFQSPKNLAPNDSDQINCMIANTEYPLKTAKYRINATVCQFDYSIATIPEDDTQYVIEDEKSRQEKTVYAEFRVE